MQETLVCRTLIPGRMRSGYGSSIIYDSRGMNIPSVCGILLVILKCCNWLAHFFVAHILYGHASLSCLGEKGVTL